MTPLSQDKLERLNTRYQKDLLDHAVSSETLIHEVLFEAARIGDTDMIEWLLLPSTRSALLLKGDPIIYNTSMTLMRACAFNHVNVVKMLLTDPRMPSPDTSQKYLMDSGWQTPFVHCIKKGNANALQALIDCAPDLDVSGYTYPFHELLKRDKIVDVLLATKVWGRLPNVQEKTLDALKYYQNNFIHTKHEAFLTKNLGRVVLGSPDQKAWMTELMEEEAFVTAAIVFQMMPKKDQQVFCAEYLENLSEEDRRRYEDTHEHERSHLARAKSIIPGFSEGLERASLLRKLPSDKGKKAPRFI